jgi:seryl-tRNA synthetase
MRELRRVELVAVAADKFAAMLDIVLFRTDQGGDPDRIRKSQKDRYADVGLVDKVIEIDTEWRKTRGDLDDAKKAKGITQKGITEAMKKKVARRNS